MKRMPTLGEILVMAGGALTFIFSFFPWYSGLGHTTDAWSSGFFLWASWVPILAIIVAGAVALRVFMGGMPERVWDYSWDQLAFIAGLFCVLITFGVLVADKGPLSNGWALILSFITSLAILAGAVLDKLGVGTDVLAGVGGARGAGAPHQQSTQQLGPNQPWSQQPSYGQQPPPSYPPPAPQQPPPAAPPPASPPPRGPAPQTPPPQTPPPPAGGEPPPNEPPPGTTGF